MDREIPRSERLRIKRRRWLKILAISAVAIGIVVGAMSMIEPGIKSSTLRFGTVDRGTLESSVSGSGRVLPAFEQIINSPVESRIVEVYCREGDLVEEGTPLLKLDLRTVEKQLEEMADNRTSKVYEMEQTRLSNHTSLSDMEMRLKVKEMAVNQLKGELANERRLDSIGSGTGERVRQAEMALRTGELELEQMRQMLVNEREVQAATMKRKQLELDIFDRDMAEKRRTFDDARLRAPRTGTLTYLSDQIGSRVGAGEKIAVLSDLTHFKVSGSIVDSYADRVAVGGKVMVAAGNRMLPGKITRFTPLSKNGAIEFSVALDNDSDSLLRSGLKTDIHILCDIHTDVVRIPSGPYFKGPGAYDLFVRDDDGYIVRRRVTLGDSNYEYVEVISGLEPGESVVIADMTSYKSKSKLRLK